MFTFVVPLSLLMLHVVATPLSASTHGSCIDFMLPVSVTANNGEYDIVQVNSNIDARAYAIDIDTWSAKPPQQRLIRNFTVFDTYHISTQLCVPANGSKKTHLQIATHGLGVDKRYWDVPTINGSDYSYVKAAVQAGYSILTYDRLGTGLSDKPDAYKIVQAPLELEILRGITEMARNGALLAHVPNHQHGISSLPHFDKIIHVGHSFGSFLTSAFLATYGKLSDAALITGYILNSKFAQIRYSAFDLEYAPINSRQLFDDRSSGYVVGSTKGSVQNLFLSTRQNSTTGIGGFDSAVLDWAYATRQTIAAAELPSAAQLNLGAAPDFAGPVQFFLAEFDFVVCQGDCRGTYDPAMIQSLYPNAKGKVDIYVQEGTGHGLTLHHGATKGYKVMFDWLAKNGL